MNLRNMRFLRWGLAGCASLLMLGNLPLHGADLADLVPEQAEVKQVAGGFTFTEGPAWHPNGFLLFTDIPNEKIHKLGSDGKVTDFFAPSGRSNGLMCDQAGNVYACQMGAGHVLKLNEKGDVLGKLVDRFEGQLMNGPNDLALDAHGGCYFTDPYYGPPKELPQPMMAVYYISAAGKVSRVIIDMERPNGVTVSPDGKTLYVAEPNTGEVYSHEILAPGKLASGKLIFTGESERDGSGPDGMTHDVDGNLYCTYNGLVVLDPQGNLIGRIPTPEKPSNCTFGGVDNKTLYITARTGLYKIDLKVPGLALQERGPELPSAQTTQRLPATGLAAGLILQTVAEEKAKTTEVEAGDLKLTVPTKWESQPPSNNLRLAQFKIPNVEGETAETELVVFPPFGGSVSENVTRWIRQFDPAGMKLKMTEGTSAQGKYYYVDVAGVYKKPDGPPFLRKTIDAPDHRMLAVMLSVEGKGNYFLKLVGPAKTVAANEKAFRDSFGAKADTEKDYKLED